MMEILILFVLIVGAITISNFVWKGAVKFWHKACAGELISKSPYAIKRMSNDTFVAGRFVSGWDSTWKIWR